MASFTALNIEPDSDSEDAIDDTKEIQIEEALKLYQTALKLHSQGPEFYPQAKEAYKALFRSEIFTYPESLSETKQYELFGDAPIIDNDRWDDGLINTAVAAPTSGVDGAPSTLPQILYLSYKNHGQFLLDCLRQEISLGSSGSNGVTPHLSTHGSSTAAVATASLALFCEALERDDTDVELWRRASRICDALGSRRLARYCLEAVLDTDETGHESWIEPPTLEESLAIEDLKDILEGLQDNLPEIRSLDVSGKQSRVLALLRKSMDPCPFLPSSTRLIPSYGQTQENGLIEIKRPIIEIPIPTWAELGKTVVYKLLMIIQGLTESEPGSCFMIKFLADGYTAGDTTGYLRPDREQHFAPRDRSDSSRLQDSSHEAPFKDSADVSDPTMANHVDDGADPNVSPPQSTKPEDERQLSLELNSATVDANGSERNNSNQSSGKATQEPMTRTAPEPDDLGNTPQMDNVNTISLPTRKRSSDSAGLTEPADIGRVRSKRIRARGTLNETGADEESAAVDLAKSYSEQLEIFKLADQWMFQVANNILSRFGIQALGSFHELEEVVSAAHGDEHPTENKVPLGVKDVAVRDLWNLLTLWKPIMSNAFIHGGGRDDPMGSFDGAKNSGLAVFLEHSKHEMRKPSNRPMLAGTVGLAQFAKSVNQRWSSLQDIAVFWIEELLAPNPSHCQTGQNGSLIPDSEGSQSRYLQFLWPDTLKDIVVQVLVTQDEALYFEMRERINALDDYILHGQTPQGLPNPPLSSDALTELVQTISELHLDIYGRITNPSSVVEPGIRMLQRERLGRWTALTADLMSKRPLAVCNDLIEDALTFRYMWSSVMYTSLVGNSSREHVVLCLQDLKRLLAINNCTVIELQNNAIMPEISVEAADREISAMATMDFFLDVFGNEGNDPIAVIESLEPILESKSPFDELDGRSQSEEAGASEKSDFQTSNDNLDKPNHSGIKMNGASSRLQLQQMSQFLDQAGSSLRLFLWRKLRNAYEAIDYPTKVLSCYLRNIEVMMKDLTSQAHLENNSDHRQISLLRSIRALDDSVIKALTLALNNSLVFECLDAKHLVTSMTALGELSRLLHTHVIYEDSVRVGQLHPQPQPDRPSTVSYSLAMNKLREMQIRVWLMQYLLMREAMVQSPELFDDSSEALAAYLKRAHYIFGLRSYCKLCNKVFLRFEKSELIRLGPTEEWESEMAQLMLDLHGLTISVNVPFRLQDHGCAAEPLDRRTAIQIMDFVMAQVCKVSVKDILKSDIRSTIEKMQQTVGSPKPSSAASFNRRLLVAYLKSPLNPIDLYRSLQGIGELCGTSVTAEAANVAEKGWYFLLGDIAFTKFRSQKRVSAGPTDDLDIAITFFQQDLHFGLDKWRTWYKLALTYDAKIDEDVGWTADKSNSHRDELDVLQRNTIHCYTMAVATAIQYADISFENASKISDLFSDFGMRLYSCSREPFSMGAFSLDRFKKTFNGVDKGMYREKPFRGLTLYRAWDLASVLFRRALTDKPHRWMDQYMLGKCLWKMHDCNDEVRGRARRISFHGALEAFKRAIESLPRRNHGEPIFEPHYKLTSVVHKLVHSKRLPPEEGCNVLKATFYARKIPTVQDAEGWEDYILQVLKELRSADKKNWHHRMVARAASIIYSDVSGGLRAVAGARHELTQQIITKTMAIQVWKPEHERPGRHYVYTSRYALFFIEILFLLQDRQNLESMAKRIRKKPQDFINHEDVWQILCVKYVKLLRNAGPIAQGQEDAIFKPLTHETWTLNTSRLQTWAHLRETYSPTLDLLREAIEFKKLNNNLMKSAIIDDVIGDTYATLYENVVPTLVSKSNDDENRGRMRVDHVLMHPDPPPSVKPSAPDVSFLAPGETAVKPSRPKVVTRREVQKKAEAVIMKPPPPTPPPAPTTAKTPSSKSGTESTFQQYVPTPATKFPFSSIPSIAPLLARDDVGKDAAISSAAGSLHDSADDESELSDLDDIPDVPAPARVPAPMFPNLRGGSNGDESSGADGEDAKSTGHEDREDEHMSEAPPLLVGEGKGEGGGDGEGEEEATSS